MVEEWQRRAKEGRGGQRSGSGSRSSGSRSGNRSVE